MKFTKKRSMPLAGTIVLLMMLLPINSCCILHQGPVSDHFDGTKFFNPDKKNDHSLADLAKWFWQMETVKWPEWLRDPLQPKPPGKVTQGKIRVTYINHATVLIQMDGLNLLTDPIWSLRAGPFSWLGSKRVRLPGIQMNDLPKVDIILISHDHYDHLDRETLAKLDSRDKPLFIVGLGIKKKLESWGIGNTIELDWWQSHSRNKKSETITFVPARHNSGRGPLCRNRTLWGGYLIQSQSGNIYFAGDTGYGKFLSLIKERFSKIDLAILPLGSYEKRWIMKDYHMNPEDAVIAHLLLKSGQSMGMHYATFLEHPEQAIDSHEKDLKKALEKYGLPEKSFWLLKFGEGRNY